MSGRHAVVCKSPVSGTWNDASSGGFFGPEPKKAGYDAVFVSGISEKPVHLSIHDGRAELRDASGLWGLDAKETQKALEVESGERKVRAAVIGPAGERLSLISCVMNDGHRAAGRGGSGAVMGSKQLKAIAAVGTGTVKVAHPTRVREINTALRVVTRGSHSADSFGTYARYRTRRSGCARCPVGCGAEYEVKDGPWPIGATARPEYETLGAFGVLLGNTNQETPWSATSCATAPVWTPSLRARPSPGRSSATRTRSSTGKRRAGWS